MPKASYLHDGHQILTVFIDLTRNYCSPICMMLKLKCPFLYGGIDWLRECDIVVDEVAVRGRRCKYFGIVPNRITSPCGLFASRGYDIFILLYISFYGMSTSPDGGRYPNKINLALRYQRLSFPRIYFLPRPQLPYLKNQVKESPLSLCWRLDYRSVAPSSAHWLRSFEWPNMFPRNYPMFKFALGDSELNPCSCCP